MADGRLNPDDLLNAIKAEEIAQKSSQLRLFLGMSAGVGKTYAMLEAAHRRILDGADVVIGIVETHGRVETAKLLDGLEIIPRKKIDYKGTVLEELDVDAIIKRKPSVVIVDELAHSNIPGSRHKKRYQDVLELLDSGIDVYSALNVQHLESRKEAVEAITQVIIRETVPDSILERASQVELVDISPSELLKRLREGKVYLGDKAERAAQNFFKEDRLTALREIALRLTAERVDQELQKFAITARERPPWQTNERLMVAVSHSPYSERLIRATRRIAYNLEAPWIAVHIDTGLLLSNEDQLQLTKNINLARELKAEIITTTETDISEALKRLARQKNVTQILVGRPIKRWFRDRVQGGSLLDRLVRENLEVDIHILSQEGRRYELTSRRPWSGYFQFSSRPIQYWNTFWFLIGTTVVGEALNPLIEYRSIGFIFLLAVLVVGTLGSLGAVVFSAVLSVAAWNFFFIPPIFTFTIRSTEDLAMCASFIVVALITGYLTNRVRFHERLIREREERTNALYEVLRDITSSQGKNEFLPKVVDRVGRLLGARCGVFLADDSGQIQFDLDKLYAVPIDDKAQAVAAWAFQSGQPAGWSTETLSEAPALYLPLRGTSTSVGVFVFMPQASRPLNSDQQTLLESICSQLGISLERHFIQKRLGESKRLEDSEILHQTLLNSISHEMRTPLTAILGSAAALENEESAGDPKFVKMAAAQLVDAGERLNRVIENLLDMSRLNSGVLAIKQEWHDVNDLIRLVVSKSEKILSQHRVEVGLGKDLPLVKMDFRFMEHALANLLTNAAAYSPIGTKISISAVIENKILKICIEDEGPGIPAEAREKVFEKFYRLPGTPTGGTGLGLSIVKSIVEAHQGLLSVSAASPSGGARFTVELPIIEDVPDVPERESASEVSHVGR